MKTIKVFLFLLTLLVGGVLTFSEVAMAATTGTVAATVTVQNISMTVSPTSIAYGTLGTNSSLGTNPSQTITATNNGNVAEDFTVKGQDNSPWILDTANTTQDHYIHKFCVATCGSPPTNYTALTTSNQTLVANVLAAGTQTFDLYITTPQTSSVYTQRSVDVTVTAAAH